MKQWNKS